MRELKSLKLFNERNSQLKKVKKLVNFIFKLEKNSLLNSLLLKKAKLPLLFFYQK